MHFDILFVMRWWIVIGCVLAACSNDGALEVVIELDPSISVDKVQLYVGLGVSQNRRDDMGQPVRELLVPQGYSDPARPNGFYWKRDVHGASDVVDVAPGTSEVRFTFHEGSHDRVTFIIVGFEDDKVVAAASIVEATIEAGMVRQYHVHLKAASDAFPRPALSAVTVHRWGPGPNDTQCAYLEDPSTDERGIYVVDLGDKDCDGFRDDDALECRPDVWHGLVRPKPDQTRCVREDVVATSLAPMVTVCVLGGPGCVDGMDKTMTPCEPSTVCAGPQHCLRCMSDPSPIDCMAELPLTSTLVTQIDCTFFVNPATNQLCTGNAILTPRYTPPVACDDTQPYQLWNGIAGWKPATFTKPLGTFTAKMPTPSCDFELQATSLAANMTGSQDTVVIYPLVNGRQAALPLRISVKTATVNGCDGSINECHVNGEIPSVQFDACMAADGSEP